MGRKNDEAAGDQEPAGFFGQVALPGGQGVKAMDVSTLRPAESATLQSAPDRREIVSGDEGFLPRPEITSTSADATGSTRRYAGLAPALLQIAAALLWVPQAAAVAYAIGRIADGGGFAAAVGPAAVLVLLGLLRAGLEAIGSRRAFSSARSELSRQRRQSVATLAARSPFDIARAPSGLAASVLAEQAEAIVPYLSRIHVARLKAVVVPGVLLLSVLPLSWIAAFVLLIAAPLIPVFMALIGMKAQSAAERQLAETGSMNAFLLDRLRGLATIRALGAVDMTARRLRADAESLRERTMAVLKIAFLSSAVLEFFAALGVAMTAVYVGFHLLGEIDFGAWGDRLSLAQGLFILLLAPAFFDPLRELSAVWHDRAAGEAALKELAELDDKGVALPGGIGVAAAPDAEPGTPDIRISRLTFRHPGCARPTLDDFELEIAAGEHVAILGASGTGKSTLLALIAGLATPQAGRISVGGIRLNDTTVSAARRRMAWIGQHPHIFSGTLASNVRLGNSAIGAERIRRSLKATKLDTVALSHAGVPIGEGGAGLSGGEALRLALARAAAKPGTGLILADEPTAHLDSQTAGEITDGLLHLARGKTLVVATHDPILAGRMHRIVRLHEEAEEVSP